MNGLSISVCKEEPPTGTSWFAAIGTTYLNIHAVWLKRQRMLWMWLRKPSSTLELPSLLSRIVRSRSEPPRIGPRSFVGCAASQQDLASQKLEMGRHLALIAPGGAIRVR